MFGDFDTGDWDTFFRLIFILYTLGALSTSYLITQNLKTQNLKEKFKKINPILLYFIIFLIIMAFLFSPYAGLPINIDFVSGIYFLVICTIIISPVLLVIWILIKGIKVLISKIIKTK